MCGPSLHDNIRVVVAVVVYEDGCVRPVGTVAEICADELPRPVVQQNSTVRRCGRPVASTICRRPSPFRSPTLTAAEFSLVFPGQERAPERA
jgi:hypothetical protein